MKKIILFILFLMTNVSLPGATIPADSVYAGGKYRNIDTTSWAYWGQTQPFHHHISLTKYEPKEKWILDAKTALDSFVPDSTDFYLFFFYKDDKRRQSITVEKWDFHEMFFSKDEEPDFGYCVLDGQIAILYGDDWRNFFVELGTEDKYVLNSIAEPEEYDPSGATFLILDDKAYLSVDRIRLIKIYEKALSIISQQQQIEPSDITLCDTIVPYHSERANFAMKTDASRYMTSFRQLSRGNLGLWDEYIVKYWLQSYKATNPKAQITFSDIENGYISAKCEMGKGNSLFFFSIHSDMSVELVSIVRLSE